MLCTFYSDYYRRVDLSVIVEDKSTRPGLATEVSDGIYEGL